MKDRIIALLEARIAHLKSEADRNPRADYARISHWRRLECEYWVVKIKELTDAKG